MPDPIFAHPRLASIYDAFDDERDDLAAYLELADELGAERVLDVGCGTGSLAILLAESGRSVVAIDPAEASLAVARRKDRAQTVVWMHGDATQLPTGAGDLAVMTGNVAQVFVTDESWVQALQSVHAALRPGGHLAFETRRPERRAWEEWTTETAAIRLNVPGVGPVERTLEVTAVSMPLVSFRYTYRFLIDDTTVVSDSTLRFRGEDEVTRSLNAHGYRLKDIRDAPDRPGRELVVIAERAT